MAFSELEILQRSEATHATMTTLQTKWTWDEISPADFEAKLQAARAAGTTENTQKATYDGQRALVAAHFDDLEARKVQGLGMATYRFRHDAEKSALIAGVGEYGDSREAILKESGEWLAAWKAVDQAWSPTSANTYAAFEALIADCQTGQTTLTSTRTNWRKAANAHNALLAELEDLCVAWYGAATRALAAGTEEGDLLRGQIPTFAPGTTTQTTPTPAPTP